MTVQELIDRLELMDRDMDVFTPGFDEQGVQLIDIPEVAEIYDLDFGEGWAKHEIVCEFTDRTGKQIKKCCFISFGNSDV